MPKSKYIYLVDCENVGNRHIYVEDAMIMYFISGDFEFSCLSANENVIRVETNGIKNALDFVIDTELGWLIRKYGNSASYIIVSKDNGFASVCDYWQSKGYSVSIEYESLFKDIGSSDKEYSKINNIYKSWCTRCDKKRTSFELANLLHDSLKNRVDFGYCVRLSFKLINNGGVINGRH